MTSLTALYDQAGMWGSWELITKFSIVGVVVQFFLTVYGLLSNVSVILRVSCTIFYLSNRHVFDEVDRVQTEGLSASFTAAQGLFNKLMVVAYSFYPNVKKLSDYCSSQFNLDDSDNTVTYLGKVALPTIGTMLFSSMAFSGLLFQLFANITDGILAAFKVARNIQISTTVTNFLNAGSNFKFSLGDLGTSVGDGEYTVAKFIYYDLCTRAEISDTDTKAVLGSGIQTQIQANSTFQKAVEKAVNPTSMKYSASSPYYTESASSTVTRNSTYAAVTKWLIKEWTPTSGSTTTTSGTTATTGTADNVDATIWDVLTFSVSASGYTATTAPTEPTVVGNSVFIPVEYIASGMSKSSGFTGYMVSISFSIPSTPLFSNPDAYRSANPNELVCYSDDNPMDRIFVRKVA